MDPNKTNLTRQKVLVLNQNEMDSEEFSIEGAVVPGLLLCSK